MYFNYTLNVSLNEVQLLDEVTILYVNTQCCLI